jgi:SIR2-like domain
MTDAADLPEIGADDFARRFALRAANLMWLLGAGSSASAGVATAGDMIWEFKQRLFISQRRVSRQAVADLSSPAVRAQLQSHIDASGHLPAQGATEEYAALFEAVYPAEADRRTYLDSKLAGARPSFGHIAVATLMRAGLCRLVWTTNFDSLVADASARVFGSTGPLTTVALDAPELATQCLAEGRWPVEIKLHGDFRSRRLKNTSDELRHQDAQLRGVLIDACRHYGLVVVGYSGRDESIMDALDEALKADGAFPHGLFWLQRGEGPPLGRVSQLLKRAVDAGVEAAVVRVENFDEALRDLVRLIEDVDTSDLDEFASERRRWSGAPPPAGRRGWPVVRLNALEVVESPSVCRRVVCSLGGYAEIRQAVDDAGVDILVGRVRAGILAFGSDADIRAGFEPYDLTEFDLHTIEEGRLRYDSGERGLLRAALARALVRDRGLQHTRRRSTDLLTPWDVADRAWSPLRRLVGALSGTVDGRPELTWREGVATRLEWADDRLWLVVDPRTVFDGVTYENRAVAADFGRERTVRRYNRQLNDVVAFWAGVFHGGGGELRALGIGDGVDAVFRLSPDTAYSRRALV